MRHSASAVDWTKLSDRARWALEEILPRLLDGYTLDEIAAQLDVPVLELEQAHALLEAETQALAGRIVLPVHTEEEYEALRESIAEHGQIYPTIYGSDGVLVDGRGRSRACRELGLDEKKLMLELPADQLQALALAVNVARRHLTASARRGIIKAELLLDHGRSDRLIARACGVDNKTVAAVRKELEATEEIPQLSSRAGADGKTRATPARAKAAPARPPLRVRVPEELEPRLGEWIECRAFRLVEVKQRLYELQLQLVDVEPADTELLQHVTGEAAALDRLLGLDRGESLAQLLSDAAEIFDRPLSLEQLSRGEAEWCLQRLGELAAMAEHGAPA